ncbi:ABC-three component system middle component 2 [Frisingicoccus sp.]|uniref:ABC-three component system middle component 2 n=1 Tax=Frisingicoccus sp. TaxID=1918627 RepID=UPI003AB7F8D2
MNKIFNTTFESSLRILLLLSVSEDEQMTLDRIADYDFITIYSKYFGISNMALHGENAFGLSEFAARRGMMQSTLKLLVLDGLVSVKRRQSGFQYFISEVGKTVAEKMETEYANNYKILARKTVEHFKGQSESKIMRTISNTSTDFLRR